ncbi:hypothetical protein JR316_0004774 [Psilocybe cubensis]|uniref:Uncharacterized protein n=2 Tax=Psilocybe cubensis TaxID=181762 RepID=A0ACB8H657_PSICU|nr:hypothetical protein JR316_0004774 [Psilocybe cubensis]KAH9482674.1 hypothetical protein JR316_0004774 [Psilocybe cubensis]
MASAAQQHTSRPSQPTVSRARMKLFNTIRYSIYGTVILFTVICLAMAGKFQSVLAASDLTRFVPFAIFVCSVSLLIFLVLSSFSFFLRGRNPISTKIELACLGLAGIFWLVLGVYLTTSDAQSADVECFSSDDVSESTPVDDASAAFHTEQYQAMYRVLNTFALLNAILVLFALFALLFLAVRRHRRGDEHMWHGPVTSCAWFNNYENTQQTRGKTSSSSILPVASAYMGEPVLTEKPERKASARRAERDQNRDYPSTRPSQPRNPYPTPPEQSRNPYMTQTQTQTNPSRNPYPTPQKTQTPSRYPTRHDSGRSRTGPTRQDSGRSRSGAVADLENGGMLNPYSSRTRGTR